MGDTADRDEPAYDSGNRIIRALISPAATNPGASQTSGCKLRVSHIRYCVLSSWVPLLPFQRRTALPRLSAVGFLNGIGNVRRLYRQGSATLGWRRARCCNNHNFWRDLDNRCLPGCGRSQRSKRGNAKEVILVSVIVAGLKTNSVWQVGQFQWAFGVGPRHPPTRRLHLRARMPRYWRRYRRGRSKRRASYGISTPDISSQMSSSRFCREISRLCGFGSRGLR
jgi:hypothetical protein